MLSFRTLAVACAVAASFAQAADMKIETLRPGSGQQAHKGDRITVHYEGRLADGTLFDRSANRGEPLVFVLGVGQVIAGWDQGLIGMKVGEQRHLVIPPELGYGTQQVGPIPPNSTLDFIVELLAVTEAPRPDSFPNLSQLTWSQAAAGVEISDLVQGNGERAAPGMDVEVHYTGWLIGGTKFDSSKDRAEPFRFTLGAGRVIRGWEQGIPGMRVGGVRMLRVQPSAGYGPAAFARIPANSTLVFRVELHGAQQSEVSGDIFPDLTSLAWQNGPEGLQYAVVQKGSGTDTAQPGMYVQVHYTGWLEDGQKFDSSHDRDKPFAFPLGAGRVIRGWDLGVEGMTPGEKRVLRIPPGLGYGSRGAGPIPGGATLVFVVEYLGGQQ